MARPLKYPASSIVGRACGRGSHAYRLVYALEQWAARHGYEGHRAHIVPKKTDRQRQQAIKFKE
jgi:hypothetical protein